MGKRKQPFGYKMKLGEIVPQPQEAEAVRSIYLQYLAGASFKQLAEQLQTEDVPYDEDKSWNKNMVARILEDDRYIGEKEFPALIPTEQFHAAQERRKEMCPEYKQTPAQKELRKLCGGTVVAKHIRESRVCKEFRDGKSFHAFRRSMGAWLLDSEAEPEMISQILGHHSRDVLKVYLPLVPSKMKVCALDFKGIEIRSGVYK